MSFFWAQKLTLRAKDTISKKVGTVRKILVSGIKGNKRRIIRCQAKSVPLHRSAKQSDATRRTKKLLAKSQWFRTPSMDQGEGRPGNIRRHGIHA